MLRDIFSLADERLKKNYYYVKNVVLIDNLLIILILLRHIMNRKPKNKKFYNTERLLIF